MPNSFSYGEFSVSDDQQTVLFDYSVAHNNHTYDFTETLRFPLALRDTPEQLRSLRTLHIALGVSYYKIFTPPTIRHPYQMDTAEATFWNDIWRNGLGEFLYVNKLDPARLAQFAAQAGIAYKQGSTRGDAEPTALLGIGGGKDSIVAGELLKKLNISVEGFVMATGEQLGQAKAVAEVMGIPLHAIERTLDKRLLTVQELPGAYKGHVPISLIFGLVGTTLAVALNASNVVVANEASASIPRISWEHGAVNHQWSKSFGFEQQLQKYVHERVALEVTYFSAVRQLTSVGVAKLFVQYPNYFEIFTSDNSVFRIDPTKRPNGRWSLESPKSLSSFILLAPWLSETELLHIFGVNLLNEKSLQPLLLSLTGQEGEPPLDCVGTVEELVVSLNIAAGQGKFHDSYLMEQAREAGVVHDEDWQAKLQTMLELQPDQAIPDNLRQSITDELTKELEV